MPVDKIFYCMVRYANSKEYHYKFICDTSIESVMARYMNRGIHTLLIEDITNATVQEFEVQYGGKYSV